MDKTLIAPQHSLDFTVSSHLPIIGLYVFQIRVEFIHNSHNYWSLYIACMFIIVLFEKESTELSIVWN